MILNLKDFIKVTEKIKNMKDLGNIIYNSNVNIPSLIFQQYFKYVDEFYRESQSEINNMKIDFSSIYPKKYANILNHDSIRKMEKWVKTIKKEVELYNNKSHSTVDSNREAFLVAVYALLLWHSSVYLLIRPVVSLKLRGLWESWMDYNTLNLNNSDLDNYRLVYDIANVNLKDFLNQGDIDSRDIELLESGIDRIFTGITRM